MENCRDFVERVRAGCSPASYYRVAKTLGVSTQNVSNWKAGRATFSDEIALKVAGILELDPGYVLACIAAEREHRPAVRQVWEKVAEGLALVLFGAGLAGAPPSSEAGGTLHNTVQATHYATRRRLAALQARLVEMIAGPFLSLL